jgi:hypothetical protein
VLGFQAARRSCHRHMPLLYKAPLLVYLYKAGDYN